MFTKLHSHLVPSLALALLGMPARSMRAFFCPCYRSPRSRSIKSRVNGQLNSTARPYEQPTVFACAKTDQEPQAHPTTGDTSQCGVCFRPMLASEPAYSIKGRCAHPFPRSMLARSVLRFAAASGLPLARAGSPALKGHANPHRIGTDHLSR